VAKQKSIVPFSSVTPRKFQMDWYFGMTDDETAYNGWQEIQEELAAQDADEFREHRWSLEDPPATQE
jgi:hypothetical protein